MNIFGRPFFSLQQPQHVYYFILLMGMSAVSSFYLIKIILLWTFFYRSFGFPVVYIYVKFMSRRVWPDAHPDLLDSANKFPMLLYHFILQPAKVWVPVAPYPCSYLSSFLASFLPPFLPPFSPSFLSLSRTDILNCQFPVPESVPHCDVLKSLPLQSWRYLGQFLFSKWMHHLQVPL